MSDCENVTVREMLPELLHERLPDGQRADVERHLAECADCRAELALLRLVAAALPAPAVDVARISAALPAYRPAFARTLWSRPALRIAAAVVLAAGGLGVLRLIGARSPGDTTVREARTPAPAPTLATTPRSPGGPPAAGASTEGAQRPSSATAAKPVAELAIGEPVHELSDRELNALLQELATLDAMTPAETEVVVPSIGRGS